MQGKHYVVGFDESIDHNLDETSGAGHGSASPGAREGIGGLHLPHPTVNLMIQEPELSFIINKYSLPRGLNSTKKFIEINDSEQIFLEEQRR